MPNTSGGRKMGPTSGNVVAGGGDQSDGGSGQKSQQRAKAARVSDETDKKVYNRLPLSRYLLLVMCDICIANLREIVQLRVLFKYFIYVW